MTQMIKMTKNRLIKETISKCNHNKLFKQAIVLFKGGSIMTKKRLTKSSTNQVISGVIGGFSEYFNVDATLLRVLFVVFGLAGGSSIWLYIILAIIMPEDDSRGKSKRKKAKKANVYSDKSDDVDDEWSDF